MNFLFLLLFWENEKNQNIFILLWNGFGMHVLILKLAILYLSIFVILQQTRLYLCGYKKVIVEGTQLSSNKGRNVYLPDFVTCYLISVKGSEFYGSILLLLLSYILPIALYWFYDKATFYLYNSSQITRKIGKIFLRLHQTQKTFVQVLSYICLTNILRCIQNLAFTT